MKKLVLVLAVAFSASLFSCSGKADKAAENADSANVAVEAAAVEAVVPDTIKLNDSTIVVGNDTIVIAAVETVEAPAEK